MIIYIYQGKRGSGLHQLLTELTPSPFETPVTTYVGMVNELCWSPKELGCGVDLLAYKITCLPVTSLCLLIFVDW